MKNSFSKILCIFLTALSTSFASVTFLESDGNGKTSHPVLFVHGRFNQTAKSWGVEYADSICLDPSIPAIHSVNVETRTVASDDGTGPIIDGFRVKFQHTITAVHDLYCNDGVFISNQTSKKVITTAFSNYCNATVSSNAKGKYVSLSMAGGSDSWSIAADWELKSLHHIQDDVNSEVNDYVMYYHEGTIPDVLASELNLDRSYSTQQKAAGINRNGLYFYDARRLSLAKLSIASIEPFQGSMTQTTGPNPGDVYGHIACKLKILFEATVDDEIVQLEALTPVIHTETASISFGNAEILTNWKFEPQVEEVLVMLTVRFKDCYNSDKVINYDHQPVIAALNEEHKTTLARINKSAAANAYYNEDPNNYGQPNQLHDRMIEVMDNFYGKGTWEDDPTALIDLIGFSQGGTTIRNTVHFFRATDLSNPVNHINRIITANTPHFGSAVATRNEFLDLPHPESGQDYGTVKEVKNELLGGESDQMLADITVSAGSIHLNFELKGKLLGPYTAEADLYGDGFFSKFAVKLVEFFASPEDRLNNRIAKKITAAENAIAPFRHFLGGFEQKADNMSWATQSPYTDHISNSVTYPTIPATGANIPVIHMVAPKVENFVKRMLTAVHEQLMHQTTIAIDAEIGELDSKIAQNAVKTIKRKLLSQLQQNLYTNIYPRITPLDEAWSNRSDLAVEKESQAGVKPSIGYDPLDDDTPFDTLSYRNTDVAHMTLDFGQFLPGNTLRFNSGAKQGHEIASLLLGKTVTQPQEARAIPAHGYMARSTAAYSEDSTSYSVTFTVQGDSYYKGALTTRYYVYSSDLQAPVLTIEQSDEMDLSVVHLGGPLYAIEAHSEEVTFNRSFEGPTISFQLSQSDGGVYVAEDDWSAFDTDITLPNGHIIVYDSVGVKMSGIEPDFSKDTLVIDTVIPFEPRVEAYSKERSWNSGNSQPSLAIKNIDTVPLTAFDSYYYYVTAKEADLRIYWMSQMDKASWSVDTLHDTLYAVKVSYRDILIEPQELFTYIDFEINHKDWSAWDFESDPSYLESSTLILNDGVCVTDTNGGILWGTKLH